MSALQGKAVSIVAVCVAVVVAAWAAMRVMDDRRDIARAAAEKAASLEEKAKAEKEAQVKAEVSEQHKAITAEKAAEKAKADAEKARQDAAKAKSDAARAAAEQKKAEDDNRTARETAAAAAKKAADEAFAAQEKAKAEKLASDRQKNEARAAEKANADKLRLAELETERVRLAAERATAEAKALELKRMHLEELEQQLLAVKRDLDEREAALKPELTIKDLVTTSDEVADESEEEKGPPLKENDMTIARESRSLARAERLNDEQMDDIRARNRSAIVARLESLYVEAVKADRVTDANYYRKELKRLYPDWEYKPPKKEEGQK